MKSSAAAATRRLLQSRKAARVSAARRAHNSAALIDAPKQSAMSPRGDVVSVTIPRTLYDVIVAGQNRAIDGQPVETIAAALCRVYGLRVPASATRTPIRRTARVLKSDAPRSK